MGAKAYGRWQPNKCILITSSGYLVIHNVRHQSIWNVKRFCNCFVRCIK